MVELVVPIIFLVVALYVLIRGSSLFIEGSKQMGAALGMSKFAIGVLIVGFGTSLPELASSVAAVLSGASEIAVANAVGSNITNIFLVVGFLALLGGPIAIKRDLIKTELPIFFIATALFLVVVFDGVVDRTEALLLIGTFGAYVWYLFGEAHEEHAIDITAEGRRPYLQFRSVVFIVLGIIAVLIGAKFTVDNVVTIATILSVPLGLVTIAGIALGTSLPELFVSLEALKTKETELAIGNIFGSNAFNILVVVGVSGTISPLIAGEVVMELGLVILLAASTILFVSGLARQVMRWEGVMLLLFFAYFLIKLTAFI